MRIIATLHLTAPSVTRMNPPLLPRERASRDFSLWSVARRFKGATCAAFATEERADMVDTISSTPTERRTRKACHWDIAAGRWGEMRFQMRGINKAIALHLSLPLILTFSLRGRRNGAMRPAPFIHPHPSLCSSLTRERAGVRGSNRQYALTFLFALVPTFMSRLAAILISSTLLTNAAAAQEMPKNWPAPVNDNQVITKLMVERLEVRDGQYGTLSYWEGEAWTGGDINKLWLKSEGGMRKGRVDEADLQAFYSRAAAPFWDLQLGARHDFGTHGGPGRDWAAFGVKGLTPYRFDMDITGYVGDAGRAGARFKVKYNLLLTQRLVLTPELEINAYTKQDPSFGTGAGLADMDAGIRLRYEIRREIAPYIGVAWTKKYGGTASLARAGGDVVHDTYAVIGIRVWR